MAETNWSKVGAVWTAIGVVGTYALGVAGLILMWWLAHQSSQPANGSEPTGSVAPVNPVPVGWWIPAAFIVIAIIGGGLLHIKATALAARARQRMIKPPQHAFRSKLLLA